MVWRRIALVLAVAAAIPAVRSAAQPAALPGNTVTCVYDYLTVEDREMALLLIAREIVDGGRFGRTSKNVMAVDRLIEEGHAKCLARFNWSIARSSMATGYALTAIMGEAAGQAIESFDHPIAPLGTFFQANRADLAGRRSLTRTDRDRLGAFLKENGWEEAKPSELLLAALYVETLMARELAARQFALTSGQSRQPIRRPAAPYRPGPAGKAGRGRP